MKEAAGFACAVTAKSECPTQPRAPVAFLLHQAQAHNSLIAGGVDPALPEIEFVVERDIGESHFENLNLGPERSSIKIGKRILAAIIIDVNDWKFCPIPGPGNEMSVVSARTNFDAMQQE